MDTARLRPLCYLDIDGVLNIWGQSNPLHPSLVARLEPVFEMRWATMWMANARTHWAPGAGYGHAWPHIEFTRHASSEGVVSVIDYKIPGILADAGSRPFVWVDDDFEQRHLDQWAGQRRSPTLLVHTDPNVGLTEFQVDRMLEWARVFG